MTSDSLYTEFISNVDEYCPTMYNDANEWANQQDQDSDLDELKEAGEEWLEKNCWLEKDWEGDLEAEQDWENQEMTSDSLYTEFIKNVDEYCPSMYNDANEWANQQDQESDLEELKELGEEWLEKNCWQKKEDWEGDEVMDSFALVDAFWEHVNEHCPEKWDSANLWGEQVNYEDSLE